VHLVGFIIRIYHGARSYERHDARSHERHDARSHERQMFPALLTYLIQFVT
jgi:hypothetical protein